MTQARVRADDLLSWVASPRTDSGVRPVAADKDPGLVPYSSIAARARSVAAAIRARGVGTGDVVCLVLPAGPDFLAAAYGTLWAGGTVSPLPTPPLLPSARYWDHVRAMLLLARPRLLLTARPAAGRDRLSEVAGSCGTQVLDVEDAVMAAESDRGSPAATALIQFTSGSSGPPKGTRVTAENLIANLAGMRNALEVSDDDIFAAWLPPYHDMGLIGCLFLPAASQISNCVVQPAQFIRDPVTWLRCFGVLGATITTSPNFGYQYAANRVAADQLAGMDFAALRCAVVGAERVNPQTIRSFSRLLRPFGFRPEALMPAYGLGEATLAVTIKRPAAAHSALEVDWEAPGAERSVDARSVRRGAEFGDPAAAAWIMSCGTPVDGCAVRVVDGAGETVADGVLGEVVVSGPSVAAGYVPGAGTGSLTTFDRDCLRTGDSGFSWRGELYVVGRSGDGVKVNGRSLYAEQVEIDVCRELGALLPAQQCVALLGVRSGEPLVALVAEIPRGSWVGTAASVLRRLAVAARIEIYAGTRGAITRTTSGKPARRLMWQRLTSGTLRATVVYAADGDLLRLPGGRERS